MGIAYCSITLPKCIKAKEALYISCGTIFALYVVTNFSNAFLVGGMTYISIGVFLRRSNRISALEFAVIAFVSNLLLLPAVVQRSAPSWLGIWIALTVASAVATILSSGER